MLELHQSTSAAKMQTNKSPVSSLRIEMFVVKILHKIRSGSKLKYFFKKKGKEEVD